jgi:hypothetical protein
MEAIVGLLQGGNCCAVLSETVFSYKPSGPLESQLRVLSPWPREREAHFADPVALLGVGIYFSHKDSPWLSGQYMTLLDYGEVRGKLFGGVLRYSFKKGQQGLDMIGCVSLRGQEERRQQSSERH